MSKLTVLEEHLASMQMNYNEKHLGKRNDEQDIAFKDIKELRETIKVLQNNKEDVVSRDISNIKVHFEEVKPDSKSILTKLFESFKN